MYSSVNYIYHYSYLDLDYLTTRLTAARLAEVYYKVRITKPKKLSWVVHEPAKGATK
jgi:hypothetical protein